MRKKLLALAIVASLATVGLAAPAQARNSTGSGDAVIDRSAAQLAFVHAIPNTTVDVYLDHVRVIDDFAPGTVQPEIRVPKGPHLVTITAATAADDTAPIIAPLTIQLVGSENYTVVAHLDAAGAPTTSFFQNNNGKVQLGRGVLTVRHVAAAGDIDVLSAGKKIVKDLSNPDEEEHTVPAGTYSISVALAHTKTSVLGPVDATVYSEEAGASDVILYVWGSAADGTLAFAQQIVRMETRIPR